MLRLFRDTVLLAAVALLISSCATLSGNGVGRVKHYVVEGERVPSAFDGFKIVFLSDLHYPSKFTPKRLARLVGRVREISPDVLLFGGDYAPSAEHAGLLFSSFSSVETEHGKYAVLGNHERRFSASSVREIMNGGGVRLLADECVHIVQGGDTLSLVGVGDSFRPSQPVLDVIEALPPATYSIVLSHTPDFAQDTGAKADLVLSGHTHGGQVSFLGLYTPVTNSKYGSRFSSGLNSTDDGVAVITTNGVGTSRKKIRFCVPSEIVVITLKKLR